MKKVGLYFGSFNPIHVGHLIIGNYMLNFQDIDEVWFVVSPKNPFKEKKTLLEDYHRLALVRVATEDYPKLLASDIEFSLPIPSFTINTLTYLKEKYPETMFSLIMGEDNLKSFHKWKNYEEILASCQLLVYPRVDGPISANYPMKNHENVTYCDAPVMNISASFIRSAISDKKDVSFLLTEPVHRYITEMHFYETHG